jgi:hypothetical protein
MRMLDTWHRRWLRGEAGPSRGRGGPRDPGRSHMALDGWSGCRLATRKGKAQSKPAAATWEETHQFLTFHCPVALRRTIEDEVARSGRSKSRVIVDAVREHLGLEE